MKLILDTHIMLWALGDPDRLSATRRQLIEDGSNTIWVSAMSAAEVAIKSSIGTLDVSFDLLEAVSEAGFEWLSYLEDDAMALRDLPFHHRDPFDRMIVTQALRLSVPVMTDDPKIAAYGCRIV